MIRDYWGSFLFQFLEKQAEYVTHIFCLRILFCKLIPTILFCLGISAFCEVQESRESAGCFCGWHISQVFTVYNYPNSSRECHVISFSDGWQPPVCWTTPQQLLQENRQHCKYAEACTFCLLTGTWCLKSSSFSYYTGVIVIRQNMKRWIILTDFLIVICVWRQTNLVTCRCCESLKNSSFIDWFSYRDLPALRQTNLVTCRWCEPSKSSFFFVVFPDPYSFDTDPDPAFRLNTDPDPDPIRIQSFDDQKLENLNLFRSKTTIYLSLGLHKGRLSYRRSLQPSKKNIQHLKHGISKKKLYFCGSFLPFWIRIRIHWPD